MQESKLLSTLSSSREAFTKLHAIIDVSTFSETGELLYEEIERYYASDKEAARCDLGIIEEYLVQKYPKRAGILNEYIESLPEAGSVSNILRLYEEQKKNALGIEVIQALAGKEDQEKINGLMESYLSFSIREEEEQLYNATDLSKLETHFSGKNLIPIYPTKLNELLGGGVPRQTQICVFARPDVGKSTTAINIAGGAALNGYKVLYIGNEDPAPRMVFRMVSRILKVPESEIRNDLAGYYEQAMSLGYENIYFVSMHPGTIAEVRSYIEKIRPDILIIDQIRNLSIKKESMTINLEQGCIATRNLAKEFNLVSIVITQAGESAHNKLILDYIDVEWSNTGVAAQMDLMIGVGQNKDFKATGKVMLSFPKNKITAPIAPFHCHIDYTTQRLRT
mgnify:CR=1 FL=1